LPGKEESKETSFRRTVPCDKDVWNEFIGTVGKRKGSSRGEAMRSAVNEAFNLYMSFSPNVKENFQLKKVFSHRRTQDDKERVELKDSYESSIYNCQSKLIKCVGISLRDFLLPSRQFNYILRQSILNHDVYWRFILLHPLSDAAKFRATGLEQPHINEVNQTQLFKDSIDIMKNIKDPQESPLVRDKFKTHIDIRYSKEMPPSYVILSDLCFFEPYHSGKIQSLTESGVKIRKDDEPFTCFGGYIPYFTFYRKSLFYTIFESNFDNLWTRFKDNTFFNVYNEVITNNE